MKRVLMAVVVLVFVWAPVVEAQTLLPNAGFVLSNSSTNIGEIAKCSGTWKGNWDNQFNQATTVVLGKFDQSGRIPATYSWGHYKGFPGDGVSVIGQAKDDSIVLEWGDSQKKTVTLTPEGKNLRAEYRKGGQINHATLTRVSD